MKHESWNDIKAADPDVATPEYRAAYAEARRDFELGMRVRELREAAGLSQSRLARLVGTSQPNIARLEAGGGMPRIETLQRVGEALGMELHVAFRPSAKRRAVTGFAVEAIHSLRSRGPGLGAAAKAPAFARAAKAAPKATGATRKAAPAKAATRKATGKAVGKATGATKKAAPAKAATRKATGKAVGKATGATKKAAPAKAATRKATGKAVGEATGATKKAAPAKTAKGRAS